MTTIETTVIREALEQVERDRQAMAQAIAKMHDQLDTAFERYLWDRLNWQGRKLRQAESVLQSHMEAECPSLAEEPADGDHVMKCQYCKGTQAVIQKRGWPLQNHRRDYDDEQPCEYCDGTGEASTTPHETADQPAKCGGCQRAIRAGAMIWRWWGQVFCSLRCCNETKTAHDVLYGRTQ